MADAGTTLQRPPEIQRLVVLLNDLNGWHAYTISYAGDGGNTGGGSTGEGGQESLHMGYMFTEGCLLANNFGQTVVTQTEKTQVAGLETS
jgi:hypothetical protein